MQMTALTLSLSRFSFHIHWGVLTLVVVPLSLLLGGLLLGIAPTLAGYESFVVRSGSMAPHLGVGDLTVVGAVRTEQLSIGDIVTYRNPNRPDVVVTHRLVDILRDDAGRLTFQTKGDANDTIDHVAVESGAILGRVVYAVPWVGYVVDFAGRLEGKLVLIFFPMTLLALEKLPEIRRRQQQQQRAVESAPATLPRTASVTASGNSSVSASRTNSGGTGWITSETGSLIAHGRIAFTTGQSALALAMFDRVIVADPTVQEAWMLKAACLSTDKERLTCLKAGLAANPGATDLQHAVTAAEHATAFRFDF
jgi:signal peptidase